MTERYYVIQRDSKNQFHANDRVYVWASHTLDNSVVMTPHQLIDVLLQYKGKFPNDSNARIRLVEFQPASRRIVE